MKPQRAKVLEEMSSYSSYILIQTIDKNVASTFAMSLTDKKEQTYNYSVSTLIIPTKEPVMITVGYYLFHLLSKEELTKLNEDQFLKLDHEALQSRIRFYLYHNDKIDSENENQKENYIEIKPLYLLLSKELTSHFSEIFKFKARNSNNIGKEQ